MLAHRVAYAISNISAYANSVTFIFTEKIENLVKLSHQAKKKSYCPYSKFPVGAALLCRDGTVIKGKHPSHIEILLSMQ